MTALWLYTVCAALAIHTARAAKAPTPCCKAKHGRRGLEMEKRGSSEAAPVAIPIADQETKIAQVLKSYYPSGISDNFCVCPIVAGTVQQRLTCEELNYDDYHCQMDAIFKIVKNTCFLPRFDLGYEGMIRTTIPLAQAQSGK